MKKKNLNVQKEKGSMYISKTAILKSLKLFKIIVELMIDDNTH